MESQETIYLSIYYLHNRVDSSTITRGNRLIELKYLPTATRRHSQRRSCPICDSSNRPTECTRMAFLCFFLTVYLSRPRDLLYWMILWTYICVYDSIENNGSVEIKFPNERGILRSSLLPTCTLLHHFFYRMGTCWVRPIEGLVNRRGLPNVFRRNSALVDLRFSL